MAKTISSNTQVTLTIKQLQSIVENAVEKKVIKVLNEYIDNGLLGNPEAIQLNEQRDLIETLSNMQEQFDAIQNKLIGTSTRGYSRNNNLEDIPQGVDNSEKFSRLKSLYENSTNRMASDFRNGTMNVSSNKYFGGADGGMGGDIDPTIPIHAQAEPIQKKIATNKKILEQKQQFARNDDEASYFDMIMETEGDVSLT